MRDKGKEGRKTGSGELKASAIRRFCGSSGKKLIKKIPAKIIAG
jgi:hypothetical protein